MEKEILTWNRERKPQADTYGQQHPLARSQGGLAAPRCGEGRAGAAAAAPRPPRSLQPKAQPSDGHFAPTAPAHAALFKPNLQLRNSKSDAEHASLVRQKRQSVGFPQLSNTTDVYSHPSPQEKGPKGAGRNQTGPGASAARGLTLK